MVEKEILEILKNIQNEMKEIKLDIRDLKTSQTKMEVKLDEIYNKEVDTTELRN
ncbi:MAG: hypothetical protein ACRC2K_06395 [Clostridium sp.]